jgi:hypothetical protein
MLRRTVVKLTLAASLLGLAFLVASRVGLWDPHSKHYWREYVQSLAIAAAEALPEHRRVDRAVGYLAAAALEVFPGGVSEPDFARLAPLFEQAGDSSRASVVWLGLARLATSPGTAAEYALQSVRIQGSEFVLGTLEVLTAPGYDEDQFWFGELRGTELLAGNQWAVGNPDVNTAIDVITRVALGAHDGELTPEQLERVGQLFLRSNQPRVAAQIWLARANLAISAHDHQIAREYAERAFRLDPSELSILTLLTLAPDTATEDRWLAKLQARFPGHELVRARSCMNLLETFAVEPPRACTALDWANALATRGRREELRLASEIADMPRRVVAEINRHEQSRQSALDQQPQLIRAWQTLNEFRRNAPWRAAGRILCGAIPFCKPMDLTPEQRLALEAICLAEYMRVGCVITDVAEAWQSMNKEVAEIDLRMVRLSELYEANDRVAAAAESEIGWWRSGRPLANLKDERSGLISRFRHELLTEGRRRFSRDGLKAHDVVQELAMHVSSEDTLGVPQPRAQLAAGVP